MKKFMSVLLALTMSVGILAGCGGDTANTSSDTGGSGGSDSASADNQAAASDEEPYEIVVEMIGSGVSQPDVAMVEEAINAITLPAINCTVKFREITIADHATQLGPPWH